MRFQIKALFTAMILASTGSAFAASTADLRVIGTVIPGSCTPVFAGGGVVDYGNISAGDLSATAASFLQARQVSYTITCDAPITIATSWVDNRLGTQSTTSESFFGLGSQGTAKIGYYRLGNVPSLTTADGAAVDSIFADGGVAPWVSSAAGNNVITQGSRNRLYSYAAPGTLIPAAYTVYAGAIIVRATIAATNTLDMTSPITLDGLSTMEVRYL